MKYIYKNKIKINIIQSKMMPVDATAAGDMGVGTMIMTQTSLYLSPV